MKTILLATDFSKAAANATDYAIELSKYFDARLVLVHAYAYTSTEHENPASFELFAKKDKEANDALLELRESILNTNHYLPAIECYAHAGSPYKVIQNACDKFNVELVVMGITGHAGKVKEHFLGSASLEVARNLDVNTIIIPEEVKYHRIHKLSFACDMDKTEESELIYAAKYFSKIFDANLEIVNIESANDETTDKKSKTLLFLNKNLETVEHKTVIINDSNPAVALENYFLENKTDLLLVHPKKHGILHNLFHGSVTKKLLFHSKQPLLVIH